MLSNLSGGSTAYEFEDGAKTIIANKDSLAFTDEDAKEMYDKLRKYMEGKRSIDIKCTENQEWWRLRHWNAISGKNQDVGSAWAVNSLMNKHADIMDSFPKPNVLPREIDDEEEAKILSSIIPAILEQCDYERVYRQMGWDFVIDGSAITGVFWDSSKHNGLGDIAITNVDVHNLAWRPGIEDIQDSDVVFHVTLEDIDMVKATWPEYADIIAPNDTGIVYDYIHDDTIDKSNMVEIVDCYYKTYTKEQVIMGGKVVHEIPRTLLHLAILVNGRVLWCSENEPGYENGFYEHGKFPFVIRTLMPVKDSIWGFGYLDIMKHPQKDIDKLDQAIIKNALQKANNRYAVKANASINKEDFADWSKEIIEIGAGDISESVSLIPTGVMPSTAQSHLERKIDELKETSSNRDFSQGGTASGVTAASAIAALQEAGSKQARDVNKELYRGAREEYYLVIELIRQFYNQPRPFRVTDEQGDRQFWEYTNAGIVPRIEELTPGGDVRHRKPVFDISISAEKQSPFSRAAQNETAKEMYSMGFFVPDNAIPALACLQMMEFEGKDKVIQTIQQNSVILQQFQSAIELIRQLAMSSPAVFQQAVMMGLPIMPPETETGANRTKTLAPRNDSKDSGTAEERAAKSESDTTATAKARLRAASAATPT